MCSRSARVALSKERLLRGNFSTGIRKILLVSVKLFARNSGAGNGCANFMDAWKKCGLSAGKTHVHNIPRFRGGGYFGFGGGGGKCRFYFYGRADFSVQGTSAKTTLLETALLRTPINTISISLISSVGRLSHVSKVFSRPRF